MDAASKQQHADLLRKAIEESTDVSRQTVADLTGRTYRTVGYWTAKARPTMPSAEERALLRKILGPYDSPGDAVERALRASELDDWRQSMVIAEYKKHLHQQGIESTG